MFGSFRDLKLFSPGVLAPLVPTALQQCLPSLNPYLVAAADEAELRWPDYETEQYWLRLYEVDTHDRQDTYTGEHRDSSLHDSPTTVVTVPPASGLVQDLPMRRRTKATIGMLSTLIAYVSLNSLCRGIHPEWFVWCEEDIEDLSWIATSKSWIDQKACRWLGVCGSQHIHFARKPYGRRVDEPLVNDTDGAEWQKQWSANVGVEQWSQDERILRDIPEYVFKYAPLVHLFSGEQYWPGDIAEHLYHTTPFLNYTPIQSQYQHPTLSNLDDLNQWENGRNVFLTSDDDPEKRPEWLEGTHNIPKEVEDQSGSEDGAEELVHQPGRTYDRGVADAAESLHQGLEELINGGKAETDGTNAPDEVSEQLRQQAEELLRYELKRRQVPPSPQGHKVRGGRSDAPAILITVAKPHGVVDAFWFYFYSFNLGNSVLNVRFGNHVGDWEHSAVRFKHGKPESVYYSEHSFGAAYTYDAVEKIGKRPVVYSATGSHANYATPGLHPYVLPWGILHDETDRGPLWDPALNYHGYTYNYTSDEIRASTLNPDSPTSWFHFNGKWGDKFYPLGDSRQYRFAGQYHYVNGPLGPKFKNLGRKAICGGPDGTPCHVKHWLNDGGRIARTSGYGEEPDEWSLAARDIPEADLQALNMVTV